MPKKTLWRWLEKLEKARRIATFSDMKKWQMPHEQGGSTPTTLYNLNVLNQLAMVCIDNEKLEKAHRISRFSDMKNVNVPTTTGAKSTTFYNLNVLNQLAMVCIDNEKPV